MEFVISILSGKLIKSLNSKYDHYFVLTLKDLRGSGDIKELLDNFILRRYLCK